MIKTLEIRNFKSLKNVKLEISGLNVFLGPNAAGKSNVVKALSFLRDIVVLGDIEEAIEKWGGPAELRTRASSNATNIEYALTLDVPKWAGSFEAEGLRWAIISARYDLGFTCHLKRRQLINRESLSVTVRKRRKRSRKWEAPTEKRILTRTRESAKYTSLTDSSILKPRLRDFDEAWMLKSKPFVGAEFLGWELNTLRNYLKQMKFYKIDVEAARKPESLGGLSELKSDGSNLARILFLTMKGKNSGGMGEGFREGFEDFMKCSVPEFRALEIERAQGLGKELISFRVKEDSGVAFPPQSSSDGTIRMMCYFLGLMYHTPPASIICFEEPETSVHPYVHGTMIDLARYNLRGSQLLLTTQSKSIADHCRPSEVFLVSKEKGFSRFQRADSDEEIEYFCKRYGIGEAWLRGLVNAVP